MVFFSRCRDHSASLEMHIGHLQKRITALKSLLEEPRTNELDNRLAEEKLAERIKSNLRLVVDDHPLAIGIGSGEVSSNGKSAPDSVFSESGTPVESSVVSSGQLRREIDSVSLDWRSLRNISECVCSTPFDHFSKKVSPVLRSLFLERVV